MKMKRNKITAEITFYDEWDNSFEFSLSNKQLAVVMKILGVKFNGDIMTTYSDKGLDQIINMKGNPLNLIEVE